MNTPPAINIFDSAVLDYKRALAKYENIQNSDNRKLRTLTYIGSVYEALGKLDSAFVYFQKYLYLAQETQNEVYIFYSLKNMDVLSYDVKEYDKDTEYLESALVVDLGNEVDQLEIQKALSFTKYRH